ncbi:FeoA family protein, partial [Escherichia coli]|uniref:FeoA family protein n=1 Tax=Escherichia coli TaxID=562 RepID=UPI001BC8B1D0
KSVGSHGALRQHFLDMGMIPGVEITVVKLAPMGDPMIKYWKRNITVSSAH